MQKNGCAGVILHLSLALCASVATRAMAEVTTRPLGVVEQPCPRDARHAAASAKDSAKDVIERILDPSATTSYEAVSPAATAILYTGDEDRLRDDWAFLCRYRSENAALRHSNVPRVVFIGDSITELWKVADPQFFSDGVIDRGVGGQTTAQMLVRFRQDVIDLKPLVVHIMGGTDDVAGNGGPTTLEAIENNIISMVDLASANNVRVVLASVPPAGAFPWRPSVSEPAELIVELNDWLRQFALGRGLIYVNYHEPLADERDAMKQTFSNDGVHPNRDGYSVMEPLARRAIERALEKSPVAGTQSGVATGKALKGSTAKGAKAPADKH
jgi:lysophospholipase L1-like esterase